MTISKKIVIANQNNNRLLEDGMAPPDHVQPFMLDVSQLRGRFVRLPNVINAIIKAHDYPHVISKLLAEALCLTTLLAGMLKFDGVFTLQMKGEGPLSTLVCDITTDGILRGYASFNKEQVKALAEDADFLTLTIRGYLAFTVDQADTTDRYQGITELNGATLTAAVQHYFKQSEQIQTAFVTQIEERNGGWTGAAIMIQQLGLEGGTSDKIEASDVAENWRRTMMLLQTVKEGELLQNDIALNTILFQLFHEEGVRVFDPIPVEKGCRCSEEKIRSVLDGLPEDEKSDLAIDGVVTVTCEFCNTVYSFPVEELLK